MLIKYKLYSIAELILLYAFRFHFVSFCIAENIKGAFGYLEPSWLNTSDELITGVIKFVFNECNDETCCNCGAQMCHKYKFRVRSNDIYYSKYLVVIPLILCSLD